MQRENQVTIFALAGIFLIIFNLVIGLGSDKTMPNEIEQIEAYSKSTKLDKWCTVGDTVIVVRAPLTMITGKTLRLIINPGESNVEAVTVSSATGRSITLTSALTKTHNPGELVTRIDDIVGDNIAALSHLEVGYIEPTYDFLLKHNGVIVQYGKAVAAPTDAAAFSAVVSNQIASDGSETELFIDGVTVSERLVMNSFSVWTFEATISLLNRAAAASVAGYLFNGVITRGNTAATVSLRASNKTVLYEDDATWDANVYADTTNGALVFKAQADDPSLVLAVAHVRVVVTHYTP